MTEINIAAHREDHPPLPYVYYDDMNDRYSPGWVLRYLDGRVLDDEILSTTDPDDVLGAVADAAHYLNSRRYQY